MNSKVDFAAGGIVLIDNKVLLVKNRLRKEYKEYYDSGFWGFPKGHMEEGESPLKAAEREVFEETGFKVKSISEKQLRVGGFVFTIIGFLIIWYIKKYGI